MGSHRAEGNAFRRQATPPPSIKPARGRRRAEPPPRGRRAHRAPASPSWVRGLPQAGVVGVLGVATIVAPLAGDVLLDDASAASASARPGGQPQQTQSHPALASNFRVVPAAEQPAVSEPPPSLVAAHQLSAEQLAALRMEAQQTSRDLERSALPGCDGHVSDPDASNGRIDTDDLCALWEGGHLLRADAAVTLARLNVQYQNTFGEQLCITDSYRSYSSQVRLRANKPGLAARAGTSEHGWGLAVDMCGGVQTAGERYRWLRDNAPEYGWDNPDWAQRNGSGPYEPWHWEYVAGQG